MNLLRADRERLALSFFVNAQWKMKRSKVAKYLAPFGQYLVEFTFFLFLCSLYSY